MPDDAPADRVVDNLRRWREFARSTMVTWAGRRRSWADHISGDGYVDEERLIQPFVFPEFAREMLGFEPGGDLAAEETNAEGTPDFTPADAVTHPFVFETKGTSEGIALERHDAQVRRYLVEGRPRIRKVVLTNLVGVRIFDLDDHDRLREVYSVNLRALLAGPEDQAATLADAQRLTRLVDDFSHRSLNREQKLQQIRDAPEWNPLSEVTSSSWLSGRLDRVVRTLTGDVEARVTAGALTDVHVTSADERQLLLNEMRLIATRLGVEAADSVPLEAFLEADADTNVGKARRQYCAHVAYYAATRLTLVRTWEDLGLLQSMLHDGGFDEQMIRFGGVVTDVVEHSFRRARDRYRSLFDQNNGYTWYIPSADAYADAIYELANTYLGSIKSDVLGQVYERTLERIDRKLLGQYYTPRDVIALIWDLIGLSQVAEAAEAAGRQPRVLDIATGSGGFLVEAASRLRDRLAALQAAGAEISTQLWLDQAALGLNGIERQRFSAYVAELNLLVQMGQVVAADPSLRIPPLGVLCADSLSLHEPDTLLEIGDVHLPNDLLIDNQERRELGLRIKAATASDFLFDVACGNPPYVGEKLAAPLLRHTRREYPYWEQFVGPHMDYLYWFLILGVSKLRAGARFGFITTEYWLRSAGAAPLRRYLSERCQVDRIVLFRDFRLFPDALGQHSMIVTGTRVTSPDVDPSHVTVGQLRPRVSIYEGGPVGPESRRAVLEAMRDGRRAAGVRTFSATVSPNALGGKPWVDVILTADQLARRRRITQMPQLPLLVTKGVETTVNTVTADSERLLSQQDLMAAGGPGTKAGIQLLSRAEVTQLGSLNAAERSVVRRVVNTRDVYPYAVVLPEDASSVIYLAKWVTP
jgi:type I restriction-modification system DNA methylase subunit